MLLVAIHTGERSLRFQACKAVFSLSACCWLSGCLSFSHIGMEMDLGEFLKSPQSWANPEVIDATFHEDFIYLRETEMLTRDEFIQHLETDFVNGPHVSTQGKILY